MQRTVGIFSIMTTSKVSYLVKGTLETIVTLRLVLIVCIIILSKAVCSGFLSLLSDTKKHFNRRGICVKKRWLYFLSNS